MYLYFSDWTTPQNITEMEKKGFSHNDRLIKVFASETDPSKPLSRPIATVISSGGPFDTTYKFPGRGPWLAEELEEYIAYHHLSEEASKKTRALFRFANLPDLEIAQLAMLIKNALTGEWHFKHPLAVVQGLVETRDRGRNYGFHLDIFTTRSQERLATYVNLNNTESLASMREALILEKGNSPEGPLPHKESR